MPRIDSAPVRLALWWTRLRLPRAQRLLDRIGVWDDHLWQGEPIRTCRGRWHGYRLRLDTSDYHQRGVYFYGRMLDIHVQLCLLAALRPGDTFIDVGANIGLLSMLASHIIGLGGTVIAFEPNPREFDRLSWHLSQNKLGNVRPQALALSDRAATMPLSVPADNTGAGTLGSVPPRLCARPPTVYDVPAQPGDDLLQSLPPNPVLIKLDIEGHEPCALRGLRRTIQTRTPAILLECNPEMLPAAGASVAELFELLTGWGHDPFALTATWSRWARDWRLHVHPMPASWRPVRTQNVLFLKRDGVHRDRLAPLMRELPVRR